MRSVTQSLKPAVVWASLVLLLALATVIPAAGQSQGDPIPLSSAPYRVGERLSFNVSFSNFISAAHVEIQVVGSGIFFGREGLQLRGHAQTVGMVNAALFSMDNDYNTYIDPETGLPFHAQQFLRESSRSADTSNDFTQPPGLPAISKSKNLEFTGTFDFLSAIYRLRALPLTKGANYYMNVRGQN